MKNINAPLRIVLVDDDKDDQMIFKEAFDRLKTNNELEIFDSGVKLIKWLEKAEELPDLIFLDLNMPIMTGVECLQEIRRNPKYRNLTVAIYSTSSLERDIEETLLNGANIYITKPGEFEKLQEIILKVLTINWQFNNDRLNKETFLLTL